MGLEIDLESDYLLIYLLVTIINRISNRVVSGSRLDKCLIVEKDKCTFIKSNL